MSLAHGGHLSHGHPKNFSGRFFSIIPYGVNKATEQIDYAELETLATEHKPKLILAGYSAYPRILDFAKFRAICDKVGAMLLVDMAHFAGLVAAGMYPSPTPYADFVTSTTHKTLRGPRGGFILCKQGYQRAIDSAIFPGTQGGPLMHVVAGKAVCFKEALAPEFKVYQRQVVANAKAMAAKLAALGYRIVSGGTDNHLMLVDLSPKGLNGKEAQETLEQARITANKNAIPFDPLPPGKASGIRLGTPAVTTRGMKEPEMERIAQLIDEALAHRQDPAKLQAVREKVDALTEQFPLYPELRHEMSVLRASGR
jgi:glycine hydroxymethyltransferase